MAAPPPDGNGRVDLDGDDCEVGFDAGVLFEPTERTRLGLLYFSGWDLEFGGDLEIKGTGINVGTDTDLDLPQMIRNNWLNGDYQTNEIYILAINANWKF